MKLPSCSTGLADLVQEYQSHLIHTAGLTRQTCAQRVRYVSRFLGAYSVGTRSRSSFQKLNAPWLLQYVLELSTGCQPHTLQCHTSAVRSFLRFLTLTGRAPAGLAHALPPIRAPHTAMGHYLSPSQLRDFLRAFDDHQPAGVRDYALALLAAKLGLRAKEIAQLSLEDVNWKAGTLRLDQTKGRRSRLLPLSAPVGQALAKYLRTRPVHTPTRQVFLCLFRPRPLTAGAVSAAVAAAFRRAGLKVSRPGTHLLRHTLATHLVQQGASLKAIADVLGHRSINTTTGYAKVNLAMLAQIAQPWPEEGR
jgi:integrase/recombinase XerD